MATNPLQESMRAGYEERDVSTPKLVVFLIFIALILVGTFFGVKSLFAHYEKMDTTPAYIAQPFEYDRPLPPSPRLQTAPERNISEYMKSQRDTLNSYGWINREQGIVRIPIERAMQLTLQQGLPTRPANDNSASSSPNQPGANGAHAPSPKPEAKR